MPDFMIPPAVGDLSFCGVTSPFALTVYVSANLSSNLILTVNQEENQSTPNRIKLGCIHDKYALLEMF